jgi:outer membrane protein assembly factor BamB
LIVELRRRGRARISTGLAGLLIGAVAVTGCSSGVNSTAIRALNMARGDTEWSTSGGGAWRVVGAVDDVVVAVTKSCEEDAAGETVVALDATTGKRAWRTAAPGLRGLGGFSGPQPDPTVPVSERNVVWEEVGDDGAVIRASALRTGQTQWTVRRDQNTQLLTGNDELVVIAVPAAQFPSATHTIQVLDRETGEQRWSKELATADARSVTSAASSGMVVVNVDNQLWGLETSTGAEQWHIALPIIDGAYNESFLGLAANDVVIVTRNAGSSIWESSGVSTTDGRVLWSAVPGGYIFSPSRDADIALIGSLVPGGANVLSAVQARTGSVLWTRDDSPAAWSTTSTRAALAQPDGRIEIVDALDGAPLSVGDAPRTQSLLATDQRAFAGTRCP